MRDPLRVKAGLVALTATAFTGGVLVASGLEWTTGSQAATLFQTAPSQREVQPVAELSEAFISISESVTPAVVSIETERTGGDRGRQVPEELRELFPFEIPEQGPQQAGGSGFLITADGYVLTNNHVVEDADRIVVVMQDNRRLDARLVGRDPTTDVAVVKVEGSGFPTVRMGRSDAVRIGEWVLAIGNPLALGTTVTSGIVSAKGRSLGIIQQSGGGSYAIEDFIQTDAAINPGNSGGPLVNLRGEVVGVNSAIASRTGFYSGYGFAIPIDLARRIADDLIRHGRVRRAALGVSVRDVVPEDAEAYGLARITGVLVNDFEPGSPAARAGLKQGDVILSVDGKPVRRVGELQRRIALHHPGETVTLQVVRQGKERELKVDLMEADTRPAAAAAAEPGPAPEEAEPAADTRLGVQVAPLTPELARRLEFERPGGVVITRVEPYGALWRRGLRTGGWRVVTVDGKRVENVAGFRKALSERKAGEVVSLVLETPEGRQSVVNVRLPE